MALYVSGTTARPTPSCAAFECILAAEKFSGRPLNRATGIATDDLGKHNYISRWQEDSGR
jgi:hypothetical protein